MTSPFSTPESSLDSGCFLPKATPRHHELAPSPIITNLRIALIASGRFLCMMYFYFM
ncbi:hypothetical protein BDW60DRAFT_200081 [Aspergillus nidulans var. acristatus]